MRQPIRKVRSGSSAEYAHHVPRRHSRSSRELQYRRQQQRNRRLAVVIAGLLLLVGLIGAAGYYGYKTVTAIASGTQSEKLAPARQKAVMHIPTVDDTAAVMPAESTEYTEPLSEQDRARREFRDLLDRKLGFINNHSLLYQSQQPYSTILGHTDKRLLPMQTTREDMALKGKLEALFASYPSKFVPHLYFFDPVDGAYVNINGYAPAPAASVIKLPVLLAYLMSVDENLITIDTPLWYMEYHRAGGAGVLQYRPTGVEFPANTIATDMIRISDNTCTNMIIAALGGMEAVNRRLEDLGLKETRIRNVLPDLTGTNMVSPYEMASVLYNIEQGNILSRMSRTNGLEILQTTHNRRLLPAQLPKDVKIAHKTGDIGTVLGDSGILYLPDGRKYILSVQVERPFNDYTARTIIQEASKIIYAHEIAKAQQESEHLASR